MPFIPISNTMKVALEYTLNGQLVVNVYHVQWPTPIAGANLTAIATVFATWWGNNMRQNFTTALSLNRIVATDMTAEAGLQIAHVAGLPSAGTVVAGPASNNVALVTSLRTGYSGRSFRGRKYWAGFNSAEVTDNFVSSTLAAAIVADMATLDAAINTAGGDLVVASLFTDGAPRAAGVTTQIQVYEMDNRVDTQRRRLPGSGE